MDRASEELRILLARLHALEVQYDGLDNRLNAIERKLDDDAKRIERLEKGIDKQSG